MKVFQQYNFNKSTFCYDLDLEDSNPIFSQDALWLINIMMYRKIQFSCWSISISLSHFQEIETIRFWLHEHSLEYWHFFQDTQALLLMVHQHTRFNYKMFNCLEDISSSGQTTIQCLNISCKFDLSKAFQSQMIQTISSEQNPDTQIDRTTARQMHRHCDSNTPLLTSLWGIKNTLNEKSVRGIDEFGEFSSKKVSKGGEVCVCACWGGGGGRDYCAFERDKFSNFPWHRNETASLGQL